MLTDTQKEVIRVFAESGMNRNEAARRLFKHYNTVYYQLIRIKEKTGLDPWKFFDMHELLRMAGAADFVDVVRCKDCKYWETVEYYPDGTKDVCRLLKQQTQDDCFCSYGEKRGEDEKIP